MVTYSACMVTPPSTRTVAQRVRDAMEQKSLTEKGLADVTGIPRTTLRRRLTGNSSFTLNELDAIARYLGLPLVDLLADEAAA